ncbi:MAG TPA: hypothetical protein VII59_01880 [Streptosporangiaceae bacterium]
MSGERNSGEQNTSNGSRPMARNERQEDDGRGGVSTITRPGVRPRPAPASRPPAAPRAGVRQRPGAKPVRGVGGIPNVRTAPPPGAARGRSSAVSFPGTHRLPFVLLLCGLLGGALVSALVISTTLAAGSFEISKLQNSTINQARQLQSLQEQVAQAQSAQQIATRATELGMRPVGELRFVDLKTGKLTTDATDWRAPVPPGYTP